MASKKKAVKKSAKGKAPPPQTPPICSWPAGAIRYRRFPGYDPHLTVTCTTLERPQILALLAEFKNPHQKFKVLMVKGSPFVSLTISPTRGGND